MNLIEENETLLRHLNALDKPLSKMDVHRIMLRLTVTTERLKVIGDQAAAQFKAGDKHATFNKQTIQAVIEPLNNDLKHPSTSR